MDEKNDPYLELFDEDLDGLVDAREIYGVSDKMRECWFFYEWMRKTDDLDQFRWLTSAFLSALRSVTFCLSLNVQHCFQDDEGVDVPDDEAIEKLSPYLKVGCRIIWKNKKPVGSRYFATPIDPLLIRLNSHRIMTIHYGPLWIKPTNVSSPSEFIFKHSGEPVLTFGAEVLALFEKMLCEIGEIGYDSPE